MQAIEITRLFGCLGIGRLCEQQDDGVYENALIIIYENDVECNKHMRVNLASFDS